jgi:dTDP-4-amino-4,6-dideoxygalactose transaminase
VAAAAGVLRGSQWNMTNGRGLAHERLEAKVAEFTKVPHAIAVTTGGIALQMSLRALGLKIGDEAVHQVDTCSATAQAVMAAGCIPLFADVSERTFMLDKTMVERTIGPRTRAIIPTHMWGNPEDILPLLELAREKKLRTIEDACLAFGASIGDRMAGSFGDVGVFSFGAGKPIQGGEGGMIVTHDESLARELRAMRHWGDKTIEYGVRDLDRPAWNGRMSEIVAAVVAEQVEGYRSHLSALRSAVAEFAVFVSKIDGLELVLGNASSMADCAFTQVVVRLDENRLGLTKAEFMGKLKANGVHVWHANFEPIPSLTLFRTNAWEEWLPYADTARVRQNYGQGYPAAERVMLSSGLGLGKMNFLSKGNLRHLMKSMEIQLLRR